MKALTTHAAKPRRKRFIVRTFSAAAAASTLAWIALAGGAPTGASTNTEAASPVADEAPGYAIEDFDYPGADRILAERNIVLKRGDGHITLADCASGTGFIEVLARQQAQKTCFKVAGNSGWLTLEMPAVHAVRGNDYTTQIDMTVGAEEKSFKIAKNAWTGVGESADEQGRDFMLVEIRSTK